MMDTNKIQQVYADKRAAQDEEQKKSAEFKKFQDSLIGSDRVQRAIVESARLSIEHREGHEPRVDIKNFPKDMAKKKDLEALNEAVDNLGITEYLNHTEAVETITDSIYELIAHLNELPNKLKSDGFEMLGRKLEALPKPLDRVGITNLADIKPYFDTLEESIKGIDIKPQVKVEVPKVKPLDLSPILEALNKEEKEEIEIFDFMVQNQKQEGIMQYFGFTHPKGCWMVMENNTEDGSYKYAFGKADYKGAWNTRANLAYGSMAGMNDLYS